MWRSHDWHPLEIEIYNTSRRHKPQKHPHRIHPTFHITRPEHLLVGVLLYPLCYFVSFRRTQVVFICHDIIALCPRRSKRLTCATPHVRKSGTNSQRKCLVFLSPTQQPLAFSRPFCQEQTTKLARGDNCDNSFFLNHGPLHQANDDHAGGYATMVVESDEK